MYLTLRHLLSLFICWFAEGLAVLVSNEPTHSGEAWQAVEKAGIATPALNELESRENWLAAVKKYGDASINKEQYKIVYATAGHEVRTWFRQVGKAGLSRLIDAIRQGIPFTQAYREVQGSALGSRHTESMTPPRCRRATKNHKPR